MSFLPSRCKDAIRRYAIDECDASAAGFAEAAEVDAGADAAYRAWIEAGRHGCMDYMERYGEVRRDPRLLLDGARTVVSCAFSYNTCRRHDSIAMYALGSDYHEVVRGRLERLAGFIRAEYGGQTRATVDTAPIRERYWAVKAGVGVVGVNNTLIVPGAGSRVFLGEVLWTGAVEPDRPIEGTCARCLKCVRACPAMAIDTRGAVDARRCLSCLTIEHRGDLPEGTDLCGRLYGCDRCQDVCPHNAGAPLTRIAEFSPREAVMRLDAEGVLAMSQDDFSRTFSHSAVKRAKLAGLRRNAELIAGRKRR